MSMLVEFGAGPPGLPPFTQYVLQKFWEVNKHSKWCFYFIYLFFLFALGRCHELLKTLTKIWKCSVFFVMDVNAYWIGLFGCFYLNFRVSVLSHELHVKCNSFKLKSGHSLCSADKVLPTAVFGVDGRPSDQESTGQSVGPEPDGHLGGALPTGQ
jgi:hypothetical protein